MDEAFSCGVDRRYIQLVVNHLEQAHVTLTADDMALLAHDGTAIVKWDSLVCILSRLDRELTSQDPAWAVRLGTVASPDARGVPGSLFLNAGTLGAAFATAVELDPLVQSAYRTRWIEGPETTQIRLERATGTTVENARACEIRFSALLSACSRVSDLPCKPVEVHFTCDPFPLTDMHRNVFGDNIVFNAPFCAMFLDAMTLSRRIPGSCAALFKQLKQQLWSDGGRSSDVIEIATRVRRDVVHALDHGHGASIEAVARRLGTSTRSLQRALAEAGLTYRMLVDRARHERASQLLKDRSHSLLSIALHLGFSDQASFTRACIRWSGLTPKLYRDSLIPPAPMMS